MWRYEMIGLEEILKRENIKVKDLANEIGLDSSTVYGWIKNNKVPKRNLKTLSEKLEVNIEYLNKKVNDINTNQPKFKGFNEYKIHDNITIIYLHNREGLRMECLIDTEDLQKLIDFNRHWQACWAENTQSYYAVCMHYSDEYKTKSKSKKIYMHRFLLNNPDGFVDHENNNKLDNRKKNFRVTENKYNLRNRKGANKNSGTGVRNVNWIEKENCYKVQIMKNYERYVWDFPPDQFEEACNFAEKKRKELFGEFAGEGKLKTS
jgi:DNA-binding Xre family transcriptional regulator